MRARGKFVLFLSLLCLSFMTGFGERQILPQELSGNEEFRLACHFINKYVSLIDSPTTEQIRDTIRRTKDDGLRYFTGNDGVVKKLTGNEDFSISFADGNYRASWSKNGVTKVDCSFPANIGLLTFSNKKELEDRMMREMENISESVKTINLPRMSKKVLRPISLSDFYTYDRGFYITPRLHHQLVFQEDSTSADTCRLLLDPLRYQIESVTNMMLTGYSPFKQEVNVKLDRYGYNESSTTLTLASLFNLLSSEGSVPYWGIDTFDGRTIKGLYVWINKQGGFAHMLSVSLPMDALISPCNIDAKLHCYLRLDNLKSLFEEFPVLR